MEWYNREPITCVYKQCDYGVAVLSGYSLHVVEKDDSIQAFASFFIT